MLSSISIIQKARIASSSSIMLPNLGHSVLRRLAAGVHGIFAATLQNPRCKAILSVLGSIHNASAE